MEGRINSYRTTETHAKSQLELVIQVYDGALAAYRQAQDCYRREDLEGGYKQLERAKRFIVHLYTTLDPDKGGDIADQLGKLYTFIINETNVVEATKGLDRIDDITTILENLRSGWSELAQKQSADAGKRAPDVVDNVGSFTTSA